MQSTSTKSLSGSDSKGTTTGKEQNQYDMVVFCHLRWDFVYQRPQHIISRMANDMKILMIEEPWHRPDEKQSRLITVNDNLHVLQPNVTSIEEIETVLPQYINNKEINVGWFYSASFVPLLNKFSFTTVVYDCMDELTLFKGAPAKLIEQEKYLMANADVVFTGGKSLYESKSQHHGNVHCFPSSVDQKHFEKALNGVAIPEDLAAIKGPIVGYFGVIDERIDYELINSIALLRPDVSFVMLGPLAKVSEEELPRQNNIHYLGMKDYKDLPAYLKGFDIAMMPFALNDATKYISPTKTLEYMAAGKPIISTAIKDVVRDYKSCVKIIDTAEEFTQAIDRILMDAPDVFMNYEYAEILKKTSWDATAGKMKTLINTTVKI